MRVRVRAGRPPALGAPPAGFFERPLPPSFPTHPHPTRRRSLSQRRVEVELRPHADSIFSILPCAGFRSVLSASRDGTVAWSSLDATGVATDEGGPVGRGGPASRLLFTAGAAVHRLHTPAWSDERLWVATTDSSIDCWALPTDVAGLQAPKLNGGSSATTPAPLLRAPCLRIAGSPAVRQLAVLPSKVHLLSEDTQGRCGVLERQCNIEPTPKSRRSQLRCRGCRSPRLSRATTAPPPAPPGAPRRPPWPSCPNLTP